MSIQIVGFSDTYKVPVFAAQIVFGAGPLSANAGGLRVLLCGMKTSAGSMVADTDVVGPVTDADTIDAFAGAGSQLGLMGFMALEESGLQIYLAAVAEPTGTVATATLLLAGTWTVAGTWGVRINGKRYTGGVAIADTLDTLGAAIAAKVNGDPRCPFTAAYVSGTKTVTFSCKNKGVQGKDWILFWETLTLPAGFVGTLTGSAAVPGANGDQGVRAGAASSGTGTEDITTILTKLQTRRYARIASGPYDAVNAAFWKTNSNSKAAPLVMQFEHVIFAMNGSLSQATTLAQSSLNLQRGQLLAYRNSETHPALLAARNAAMRAATENSDPVPDYDGRLLTKIAPQTVDADRWTPPEQDILLNAGVTPVVTAGGDVKIVRGITTYSLLGGATADDRTLDIGDSVFPDYGILDLQALYWSEFRVANKYVGPDPAEGALEPPAGVGTPRMWNTTAMSRMLDWFTNQWIEDPNLNPPQSEYNRSARGIRSQVPMIVRRVQHSIGVVGRQQ